MTVEKDLKEPLIKQDEDLEAPKQEETYSFSGAKDSDILADLPSDAGLNDDEVEEKLATHGYNEIVEKKRHPLLVFATFFWGPMPWMIEIAAIISAAIEDWKDFIFLIALLFINGTIGFSEEFKAGNAVEALKASLALRARVKRNGEWTTKPARELVPGDVVMIRLGDVIPADSILLTETPIEVDQAALTGESLPVTKFQSESMYAGSVVKMGEAHAYVTKTGRDSFFGKAASLVDSVTQRGHFQQVLFNVAKFLIAMALVLVLSIFFQQIFTDKGVADTLKLCLVLMVASIPIAMQVVCTATMAVGARRLAKENAIVSRLSAIEELAGMDVLCSDKTGTLTLNKLTLDEPYVTHDEINGDDLIFLAALACARETTQQEPIDNAITNKARNSVNITLPMAYVGSPSRTSLAITQSAEKQGAFLDAYEEVAFKPFDPISKRAEATIKKPDGKLFKVCKGSPQVVLSLCSSNSTRQFINQIQNEVDSFANRGYRTLGVAQTDADDKWEFLGLIPLFDPPREDTKETIERALALGVDVKMVTGDHIAIAKETARRLGIGTNMLGTEIFQSVHTMEGISQTFQYGDLVETCDGFAQVFPEHKFAIVDLLQKREHTCGMTGDGVNDAPALKKADVGIAVQGATDAARAAADIVLLSPGLSTIITAIMRSRMIFQRMRNYCIYRIACTIQILFFFFFSIIFIDFNLPAFTIVLIAILNDGTIMSIAYDNVKPGPKPEVWNLPIVCGVSATLGLVGVGGTFFLLWLARETDWLNSTFGLTNFSEDTDGFEGQLQALIYLQLSIGGQLTVFAGRTKGMFFSRRPGYALLTAFFFAQTIATMAAVFPIGPLKPMMGLAVTQPICNDSSCATDYGVGFGYALFVWVYCIIVFIMQDFAKLGAYQLFDWHDERKDAKREEQSKQKIMRSMIAGRPSRRHEKQVREEKSRAQLALPSMDADPGETLALLAALVDRVNHLENEVARLSRKKK